MESKFVDFDSISIDDGNKFQQDLINACNMQYICIDFAALVGAPEK